MSTKFKRNLALIILGLNFSAASAQTPPDLENLFRLEGKWQGPAVLIFDGNTFNFTYYADFRKNEEGIGMFMDESFSHPDIGTLIGYNLIGYNSRDEKIHWFSVDNFGTCHDHFGYWKSPNHFYMETSEKRGGKKFEEKIDLIIVSPTEITLKLIALLGGQVFQEVTVTFFKQPAS